MASAPVHSTEIVVLGLVALVGLVVFVIWELTDDHPVVDLRLFSRQNFAFGVATLSIGYGLFFGNVVILPLWLQQHMGYTASVAGMAVAASVSAMVLPLAGGELRTVQDQLAVIDRWLLSRVLRRWMDAVGFRRPILWSFLPTPLALDLIRIADPQVTIYYCIDDLASSSPEARRISSSEVARSGSPAIRKVTKAGRPSFLSSAKRVSRRVAIRTSPRDDRRRRRDPCRRGRTC